MVQWSGWGIGKHMEGCGCGWFEVLSHCLYGVTEESYNNSQSWYIVSGPRFEAETFQLEHMSFSLKTMTFICLLHTIIAYFKNKLCKGDQCCNMFDHSVCSYIWLLPYMLVQICSLLRTALSCVITQQMVLIPYQRFRTAYRSIFKGQESNSWSLKLEDGTDKLSKNNGKELPPLAVKLPKRAQFSSASWQKPEITHCLLLLSEWCILGKCVKCNIKWHPYDLLSFWFQLFYLITDLYKEGNAKEMKKWAYEIHSSFLVPGAVSSYFLVILRHVWLRLPQDTDVVVSFGVLLGK